MTDTPDTTAVPATTSAASSPASTTEAVGTEPLATEAGGTEAGGTETPATTTTEDSHQPRHLPTLLAAGALCFLLPAAMVGTLLVTSQAVPTEAWPAPTPVAATPQELSLVCLDAHIDPFTPNTTYPVAPSAYPSTLRTDGRHTIHVNTHNTPNPFALTAPTQTGGDLRGLSLLPCGQARSEHWFALGATTASSDTSIRVVNPGTSPTTLTLSVWGSSGPLKDSDHTISIPAGDATTIRPGRYAPNESRLAVQLRTDGPGVGAWMHLAHMNGETPQGSTWAPSARLATHHLLPGLGAGNSTLRLANPGSSDTTVTLTWMTDTGTTAVPGGVLELAAGSVTDVSLPGITQGYAAVLVDSDTAPVLAQGITYQDGAQWPGGAAQAPTWRAAAAIPSASPTTAAVLPQANTLTQVITEAATQRIIRPTALPTPTGLTIESMHLLIAHTADQPVTVHIGDASREIPAQALTTIDLTTLENPTGNLIDLHADQPLSMSIIVEATTPTGPLRAVMPLSAESLAGATLPVILQEP